MNMSEIGLTMAIIVTVVAIICFLFLIYSFVKSMKDGNNISGMVHDDVCEFCDGTGELDDYWYNHEANEYIPINTKKCICQLDKNLD